MARKDDGESAISLFSFQDIITSITGIMFLVVLLLVLLMITSRIPDGKKQQNSENVKDLQKELSELKNKLQNLRQSQLQLDKQLDELKKLSPEEVQKKKIQYRQILRIEQAKLEKITHDLQIKDEKYKQLQAEHIELDKWFKQRHEVIMDMQKRLKELTEAIKKYEELSKQRNRVIKYVVFRNTGKQPILAELDKDGIRFMHLQNKKTVDLRRPGKAHESLPMLAAELKKIDPAQHYFSLAVKPGGFKYVIQTLEILKNNNFERGTEILPDDDTSIFEEKSP